MAEGFGGIVRRMLGMQGQANGRPSQVRRPQPGANRVQPNSNRGPRPPQQPQRPYTQPAAARPPQPPPGQYARPPAQTGQPTQPPPGQHARPPAQAAASAPQQPPQGGAYGYPPYTPPPQQTGPAPHNGFQQPANPGGAAQPPYGWQDPQAAARYEPAPPASQPPVDPNHQQFGGNQLPPEPEPETLAPADPPDTPPVPEEAWPEEERPVAPSELVSELVADDPALVSDDPEEESPGDRDDDDDDEDWMYADDSDDLLAIENLADGLENDLLPPGDNPEQVRGPAYDPGAAALSWSSPVPRDDYTHALRDDPLSRHFMSQGFDERNYSAPPYRQGYPNENGREQGGMFVPNLAMAGYGPGMPQPAAAPVYTPPIPRPSSNARDQAWVDQQVQIAQNDDSGILWLDQAMRNPLPMYRHWRSFNQVFSNNTLDTWLKVLGVAIVASAVLAGILLFSAGAAGSSTDPVTGETINKLPTSTSLWLVFASVLLGVGGAYWYWCKLVFAETYVKIMVMGRYNFIDLSECEDILIFYVQRLALANRPDVFIGNNGRNGIKDKQSYVRLKTTFGMFVSDICYPQQVYNLPKDDDGMQFASATVRYDLYRMAETLGDLLAEFHTTSPNEMVAAFVTNNMPWFLSGAIFLVGLFILLQLFQ